MANEREFVLIYNRSNPETEGWEAPEMGFLRVPPGYHLDKVIVRGILSVAQGYNLAMGQTAARYKIYLQEGAAIVYQDFLEEVLGLFLKYSELGLLGVMGAKRLPPNGVWWEARETYGQMDYRGNLIQGSQAIMSDYAEVQAIDGIMMATQYDLPWREDLFSSRYFYDIAQSLEFTKAGYTVGVAKQKAPWLARIMTDDLILYQQYRRVFVKEYGSVISAGQ
ncbi:MAG TPA: glycosyltransferase family protein [Bacillota bacterium]|nr:glycosyltransferase family protein [Bacillota bacterium]